MQTYYVIPAGSDAVHPPAADAARATALGCSLIIGDPSGQVTVYPSVAVTSSACAPQIIADDQGQATLAEVQAAQATATAAETAAADALTTARTGLSTLLAAKDTLTTQLQTDAAGVAADQQTLAGLSSTDTTVSAVLTLLANVLARQGRMLTDGLADTMQAHIDHLTVNGITS